MNHPLDMVHGLPHGPGPWTTPWITPNFLKEIASVIMKIHQRSGWSSEVEIPEIQKKPRNPNRIIVFNSMFDLELNNQVRNGN